MKKRTFFLLFSVMLAILLVLTVRELPKAPPLPQTLEQDARGWYWGESADSLAAAVPDGEGLRVLWVDKANPSRLFFKKCKTADPDEALKRAAKRPLYTSDLTWRLPGDHFDGKYMDYAAKIMLEEAGAQGNGGQSAAKLLLPRKTHKAGAALLTAAILEVTPQQALESIEKNVWEGIWGMDCLIRKQEFYYYRGLVDLQWYNIWGTTADVEHRGSTDARDHLYVIE